MYHSSIILSGVMAQTLSVNDIREYFSTCTYRKETVHCMDGPREVESLLSFSSWSLCLPWDHKQLTSWFSLVQFIPFSDPLFVSHLCSLAILSKLFCCSYKQLLSCGYGLFCLDLRLDWCTCLNAGPSPWEQHASAALRILLTSMTSS